LWQSLLGDSFTEEDDPVYEEVFLCEMLISLSKVINLLSLTVAIIIIIIINVTGLI